MTTMMKSIMNEFNSVALVITIATTPWEWLLACSRTPGCEYSASKFWACDPTSELRTASNWAGSSWQLNHPANCSSSILIVVAAASYSTRGVVNFILRGPGISVCFSQLLMGFELDLWLWHRKCIVGDSKMVSLVPDLFGSDWEIFFFTILYLWNADR